MTANINGCAMVEREIIGGVFTVGQEQGVRNAERYYSKLLLPCRVLISVLGRGTRANQDNSVKTRFGAGNCCGDAECFSPVGNSNFAGVVQEVLGSKNVRLLVRSMLVGTL
jgi:hypothetical protein